MANIEQDEAAAKADIAKAQSFIQKQLAWLKAHPVARDFLFGMAGAAIALIVRHYL